MSSKGNAPDIIELLPIDEDICHGENCATDTENENQKGNTNPTRKQKRQVSEKKLPERNQEDPHPGKASRSTVEPKDDNSINPGTCTC